MSDKPSSGAAGVANAALWTSTVAFTACFAVWTIFSIIGLGVKDELGLSETEFGLLIGTPILTGSQTRVVLGIWSDQFGGRRSLRSGRPAHQMSCRWTMESLSVSLSTNFTSAPSGMPWASRLT